jgi:hypothetical protein
MPDVDGQDSSRRKRISAFALAKIDFSVRAEIGVDDVQALRPAWNNEECMQFLRQAGDEIGKWQWPARLLWPHC